MSYLKIACFIWLFIIAIKLTSPLPAKAEQDCRWNYVHTPTEYTRTPKCSDSETAMPDSSCANIEQDIPVFSTGYNQCCCTQKFEYVPVSSIMPNLQIPIPDLKLSDLIDKDNQVSIPWIAEYVIALYDYAIFAVVLLAGLALVVGGLIWIASGGNSGRVKKSQEIIIGSIIGLILIFSAHILLMTINPELTKFKAIPLPKIAKKDTTVYAAPPDLTANNCTIELGEDEFPGDTVQSNPAAGGAQSSLTGSAVTSATSNQACSLNTGYSKNGFYFVGLRYKFSLKKPLDPLVYCPAASTNHVDIDWLEEDIRKSQSKDKKVKDAAIESIRNRILNIAQSFYLAEANTTNKITSYNCSTGYKQNIERANIGAYASNNTTVHHCVDVYAGVINMKKDRKIQLFDCGGWVGYVYACAGLAIPNGPTFDAAIIDPQLAKAEYLGDISNINKVKNGEFFGITGQHAMLKFDKNYLLECVHNQNTKENIGCLRKSSTGQELKNRYSGQQLITFSLEYIINNTAKNFYPPRGTQ